MQNWSNLPKIMFSTSHVNPLLRTIWRLQVHILPTIDSRQLAFIASWQLIIPSSSEHPCWIQIFNGCGVIYFSVAEMKPGAKKDRTECGDEGRRPVIQTERRGRRHRCIWSHGMNNIYVSKATHTQTHPLKGPWYYNSRCSPAKWRWWWTLSS